MKYSFEHKRVIRTIGSERRTKTSKWIYLNRFGWHLQQMFTVFLYIVCSWLLTQSHNASSPRFDSIFFPFCFLLSTRWFLAVRGGVYALDKCQNATVNSFYSHFRSLCLLWMGGQSHANAAFNQRMRNDRLRIWRPRTHIELFLFTCAIPPHARTHCQSVRVRCVRHDGDETEVVCSDEGKRKDNYVCFCFGKLAW